MKALFYLGHPAHFHLFRRVIAALSDQGHETCVAIKKKDVLEELVRRVGWSYRNVLDKERGNSRAAMAWAHLKRDARLMKMALQFRPDVMAGTSAEITHVGSLLGIPSVVVNEDDADVVPLFAGMAYPFATRIVAPRVCRMGKWEYKTVRYDGYHELAYLHPNHFTPDPRIPAQLGVEGKPFFVLRFAHLVAHHDRGVRGIDAAIARRLIGLLESRGRVFITSERPLEVEFESHRIRLDPLQIHHALYYATMYVGDSQTMAAEAAVLGTPAVRYNDFVGRISYLAELEQRYELAYGINPPDADGLCARVSALLAEPRLKSIWDERRRRMLHDKIDVAAFLSGILKETAGKAQL